MARVSRNRRETKLKQFTKSLEESTSKPAKLHQEIALHTPRNLIWEAHHQVTQCNYIALPFFVQKVLHCVR
jgi:hypothetical protein